MQLHTEKIYCGRDDQSFSKENLRKFSYHPSSCELINLTHQIQANFYSKILNYYQLVFKTPSIDWCAFMEGGDLSPMLRTFFKSMRDEAPGLFQKCPYSGHYEMRDFQISPDLLRVVLLPGVYKIEANVTDSSTKFWGVGTLFIELK